MLHTEEHKLTLPEELPPFARLKPGITEENFKVEIDRNSLQLLKMGNNYQRYAIVGWWKDNVLKIRFNLGFRSDISKTEWKLAQYKYGKSNTAKAAETWLGRVHAQTIKHVREQEADLGGIETRVGLSLEKKNNINEDVTELSILGRSIQNRRSFIIDPIANAYFAFEYYEPIGEEITPTEADAWYARNLRNVPEKYFKLIAKELKSEIEKLQQSIEEKEGKSIHIDFKLKIIEDPAANDWRLEREWQQELCEEYKENPDKALQKIKQKLIKNLFIYLLNGTAKRKKADAEDVMINGIIAASERYGIQFNFNSSLIPEDIEFSETAGTKRKSAYPLELAIENNNLKMIKFLLSFGAKLDPLLRDPIILLKSVEAAAKSNNLEVLQFLLANGFKFDTSAPGKENPKFISINVALKIAVENNNFALVQLLIQNGANFEFIKSDQDLLKKTIIHFCENTPAASTQLIEKLFELNFEFNFSDDEAVKAFIMNVAQSGNIDLLKLLISKNSYLSKLIFSAEQISRLIENTVMHYSEKKVKVIDFLITHQSGIKIESEVADLALRLAILSNNITLFNLAIRNGAKIEDYLIKYETLIKGLKNLDKSSGALESKDSDHASVMDRIFAQDIAHKTAFTLLTQHGKDLTPKMINYILNKMDINTKNEYELTALDVLMAKNSDYFLIKKLFNKGMECSQLPALFIRACECNDLQFVKTLLTQHSEFANIIVSERTPLDVAISKGNLALVELLLKYKAIPDKASDDQLPLSRTLNNIIVPINTFCNDEQIALRLMNAGAKVDIEKDAGNIMSMVRMYAGLDSELISKICNQSGVFEKLLEDIDDLIPEVVNSLLLTAIKLKKVEYVEVILKNNPSLSLQMPSENNITAIDVVCRNHDLDMLKLLLNHEKNHHDYPLQDTHNDCRFAPDNEFESLLRFKETSENDLEYLFKRLPEFKLNSDPYRLILESKTNSNNVKFMKMVDLLINDYKRLHNFINPEKKSEENSSLFAKEITSEQVKEYAKLFQFLGNIEKGFSRIVFTSSVPFNAKYESYLPGSKPKFEL